MALDEDYPRKIRKNGGRLRQVLECATHLTHEERASVARNLADMADLACDLEDIVRRLLEEQHTPQEVGELLIAFELTTEQLRGSSDEIDGKLYEIGDRLKGTAPTNPDE
jgi:hypothetical protein